MSVCSYYEYEATFPKDTPLNEDSVFYGLVEEYGDQWRVADEGDGDYSDTFLNGLIDVLGKALDEVPGLVLDAYYHLYDDDGWQFMLHIDDGKVECQETEIVWRACDLNDTDVNLGIGNLRKAKEAWDALTDVPVDDDGCFVEPFRLPYVGWVTAATPREEVWHMIEERTGISVAYLMGEAKNPDGTN